MYIGQDLQVAFSSYLNIDDISGSFNSVTTSFALTVNGSTPVPLPINSQQCLISVGGIIQRPDDTGTEGFRLSGSNIVFSSAPNTGEDFFGTILAGADYINAGVNFPDGQSGAPSITFDQDLDTGFFRSSSGAVSFSSNGVNTATLGSNSFTAPSFIPTSSSVPSNGVFLPAANSVAIATNGTQQATVDSSGRLLVGTSTASTTSMGYIQEGSAGIASSAANILLAKKTTVVSDGASLGTIYFSDSSQDLAAYIDCARDGGTWTSGSSQPTRLTFSTTADAASSPTERMRIGQNGAFNHFTSGGGFNIRTPDTLGSAATIYLRNNASSTLTGTTVFVVAADGDVVNANNSYGPLASDERLKQDITDANSQWDDIKNIRITNFHYKNDPAGPLQLGPIAQELEKVSPGLITRRLASEDEVADPSNGLVDGDEVLSFKASILYMKAVKALQEAMERIETLESKVAALESA